MPELLVSEEITIGDLKAIVHGLKMCGFGFIDPDALDPIRVRIKDLPSSEALDSMEQMDLSYRELIKEVGEIMRLIEIYGKRDQEFSSRYKAKRELPPRYKVLEWREVMKQEAKNLVRNIVQASSTAEEKGHGDLSGSLVRCAKLIKEDDSSAKVSFADCIADMRTAGLSDEASALIKEAQGFWSGLGTGIKNTYDGVKNQIMDPARSGGAIAKAEKRIRSIKTNVNMAGNSLLNLESLIGDQTLKAMVGEMKQSIRALMPSLETVVERDLPAIKKFYQAVTTPQEVAPQEAVQTANQSKLVRNLVRVSRKLDKDQKVVLAKKSLLLAQNPDAKEIEILASQLKEVGYNDDAELFEKLAQGFWSGLGSGVGDAFKGMGGKIMDPARAGQALKQLKKTVNNVVNDLTALNTDLQEIEGSVKNPQLSQAVNILQQNISPVMEGFQTYQTSTIPTFEQRYNDALSAGSAGRNVDESTMDAMSIPLWQQIGANEDDVNAFLNGNLAGMQHTVLVNLHKIVGHAAREVAAQI